MKLVEVHSKVALDDVRYDYLLRALIAVKTTT